MKETLEKRIESEILIMIERCNVLEKHILGYLAREIITMPLSTKQKKKQSCL